MLYIDKYVYIFCGYNVCPYAEIMSWINMSADIDDHVPKDLM